MSILAALARAYERLEDAPPFGYSMEKIGFLVPLNEAGSVAGAPVDLRISDGRKMISVPMPVPQAVKRTSGVAPNFLWDKTAYVLGITAGSDKRLDQEHAAFKDRHAEVLRSSSDAGLKALRLFLENWTPENFTLWGWPEDMKDQNVVFALESERRQNRRIHDRSAARELWAEISAGGEQVNATCLVTGHQAPVARLHSAIKGVWGGQSSGGSIVSFNLDAFESYGHEQGDNAPVSEEAAFAYTTALNRFLSKDSSHRIQIGDASTVFWADASSVQTAQLAESAFSAMFAGIDEETQAKKVGAILEKIRQGRPLGDFDPDLARGVRFHVLGLSPNAARISVRFYFEDDFGVLAERYQRFVGDMAIEPPPRDPVPRLWRYLVELAVQGKADNIPPNLAGDWMRAILTGTRYPQTLLSTMLMRIRADKRINAHRASLLKALLIRNHDMEVDVALDTQNTNKGYLLGRLFATYEQIQKTALGSGINATIKDKFYSSASAQPRKVFSYLEKGSVSHLSKIGKDKPGFKVNLEKQMGGIMDMMEPGADPFPTSLSAEEQALFGLGYYHQRSQFFKSKEKPAVEEKIQ